MQCTKRKTNALARALASTVTVGALVLATGAVRAGDQDNDRTEQRSSQGDHHNKDTAFLKEAARSGQMEVRMGQMGKDRGQNSEVKQLAERIVQDHTKANEELKQLASKKGVDVASATTDSEKHHGMDFSGKSGADFDKAYARAMVRDHKKDIAKFEKASRDVQDPELKAFIDKTLPTLREHLSLAQAAARSVGLDDKSISSIGEADASGAAASGETNASTSRVPDTSSDADANNARTIRQEDRSDRDIKSDRHEASASSSVNIDTDKNDGKTLGVTTEKNDGKTLGVATEKNDGKTLGVKTRKGDNRVLGLNTDKNDGKLLGIFPAPHRNKRSANADVSVNTDSSSASASTSADINQNRVDIGAPAANSTENSSSATASTDGTDKKHRKDRSYGAGTLAYSDVPTAVQDTIRAQGGSTDVKNIKKETHNGQTVYKVEVKNQGKNTVLHINEDGTLAKDNRNHAK